jgi:hypothetical protein
MEVGGGGAKVILMAPIPDMCPSSHMNEFSKLHSYIHRQFFVDLHSGCIGARNSFIWPLAAFRNPSVTAEASFKILFNK